ncbi:hypothetical protein R3P38DRAFT_2766708 [Favolaschia claudopus]|uniref:Uncharacterized protein n=1 Tax=Favolaschia claudopus TaxID=2862362 RepID=A0AAW0D1D5_9AGAR
MEKLPVDLPFANSVYTTCELRYGDTPTFDDFNDDTAFDTMDATSVLGLVGGHVTFQEDQIIQQLRVGHTVLAASGSKRINFPTVKKLGRRFLFRQYVDAGVLRWIEKGGRTDKEFEALPEADRAAWVAGRRERAETGLRMFGNIADVVLFLKRADPMRSVLTPLKYDSVSVRCHILHAFPHHIENIHWQLVLRDAGEHALNLNEGNLTEDEDEIPDLEPPENDLHCPTCCRRLKAKL